jgi:hypothetical protein
MHYVKIAAFATIEPVLIISIFVIGSERLN